MPLSPRLRWKLERYRRTARDWLDRAASLARASTVKHKVCPACRALVDARDSRCPFCNERLSALDRVGLKRLAGALLPSGPQYTTLLLLANFVLFGLTMLAATRTGIGLESMFGHMPGRTLVDLGARDYHVAEGQWWRLIAAMFLHGNIIHLLFNSLVLFDLGPSAEEMYGPSRFLVLYLLAGIGGSLASFFWHPFVIMVGASGALFGLIGVMIAYGYRHRTALGEQVKSMYLRWAIYGLIMGFVIPGVDNAAHVGGLIAGLVFGALVSDTPSFSRQAILGWRLAGYLALLLITVSFLLVGLNYGRA
jgi:rhomboid protease GluP